MHVHLYTGSRLVVLGPSGIGKSLLLRAIASLDPLAEGQITLRTADKGVVRLGNKSNICDVFINHYCFYL
jgi:ABC-type uncharacterized transport system fused permease/ATPase subunit